MSHLTAEDIIQELKLMPHPEGGYYREVYRSSEQVTHPEGPASEDDSAQRAAMTSIYFLLEKGDYSTFHRVRQDETWNLYLGGPLELHLISQHGAYSKQILGYDLGAGYEPQLTVPGNSWQAARPAPGVEWALVGCKVAPGFDFADFRIAHRRELLLCYPEHEKIVCELTRDNKVRS